MTHAERGRLGAEKRWGPGRVLHLGDLTPAQRRLVAALVDAVRKEEAAPPFERGTADAEDASDAPAAA
jgi:hypothetical protein